MDEQFPLNVQLNNEIFLERHQQDAAYKRTEKNFF